MRNQIMLSLVNIVSRGFQQSLFATAILNNAIQIRLKLIVIYWMLVLTYNYSMLNFILMYNKLLQDPLVLNIGYVTTQLREEQHHRVYSLLVYLVKWINQVLVSGNSSVYVIEWKKNVNFTPTSNFSPCFQF